MLFLTAFLTGLFGSFHCVGMCGPIAFALPTKSGSNTSKIIGRIIYNLGRIFTYSVLGLIFGFFGLGLKLAGLQQSISIAAGILIIITVFINFLKPQSFGLNPFKFLSKNLVQKLFKNGSNKTLFIIGLLNGLLPCGFVYIALIGASVTQNALQGALFMALFGLGTFPLMFSVSLIGQFLSVKLRSTLSKLTPYLAVLIACLFILRGLNLGIPYVSPKISKTAQQIEYCK